MNVRIIEVYAGISVDRFHSVTGCLIDVDQGGFREGRGCVDQIFTLKPIGVKEHKLRSIDRKRSVPPTG